MIQILGQYKQNIGINTCFFLFFSALRNIKMMIILQVQLQTDHISLWIPVLQTRVKTGQYVFGTTTATCATACRASRDLTVSSM